MNPTSPHPANVFRSASFLPPVRLVTMLYVDAHGLIDPCRTRYVAEHSYAQRFLTSLGYVTAYVSAQD